MKKITSILISIMIVIAGLISINGLASALPTIRESLSNSTAYEGLGYLSVDLLNQSVPTSAPIEITFYDIGSFSKIDGIITSVSDQSITTANMQWKMSDGTVATSNILTFGTAITYAYTAVMTMQIYCPSDNPVTVTGSIKAMK